MDLQHLSSVRSNASVMVGRVSPLRAAARHNPARRGLTRPTRYQRAVTVRNLCVPGAAALLLMLMANLCGCSGKAAAGTDAQKQTASGVAVPVVVAQAEAQDVAVELRNIGNVEAYSTVTIRSQVTGQITKVHFREGQEVNAGDMLLTIDPRPAEGALHQAQADLKRDQAQLTGARLEFEREKKLVESSIASRDNYEKAEAAFQAFQGTVMADEAALSRARLMLEFCSIRSPIDGRTGNLMVKEGNIVKAPDDALVTLNQVHPIYVTFSVPEQELPAIRERMRLSTLSVEVETPAESTEPPRGQLTFIDNAVDTATGRIKLKATFANTNDVLWPGQFLQTKLTLRTLNQATVVPAQAIQSSQNGDFVFVVKPDSTVQKQLITAGLTRKGMTVIENGLQPGQTVVTDGQLRLRDGSPVTKSAAPGPQASQMKDRGTP